VYCQARDVRVREVPEMDFCLVYVATEAEIYRLNPSAWYVLRMCDGRTEEKIARSYHAAMRPVFSLDDCRREVRAGIESLLKMGIIEQSTKRRARHAKET
jgi:hypothetical protein